MVRLLYSPRRAVISSTFSFWSEKETSTICAFGRGRGDVLSESPGG